MKLEDLCSTCQKLCTFLDDASIAKSTVVYDDPGVFDTRCRVCAFMRQQNTGKRFPIEVTLVMSLKRKRGFICVRAFEADSAPILPMTLEACRIAGNKVLLPIDGDDDEQRPEVSVTTSELPVSTGDKRCLDTVISWVKNCTEQHEKCRRAKLRVQGQRRLPTRLVELLDDNEVRVADVKPDDNTAADVRYVTLSYRWNREEDPKLLRSNSMQWKRCMDANSLPPVFQDAIDATRRLGLRYIWIDALCIVQDDIEDWRYESSMMGEVYQNAYLNLSATAAAQAQSRAVGLYTERDPTEHSTILLTSSDLHGGKSWVLHDGLESGTLSVWAEPLMTRGWVYQERILSPRTVFFSGQLKWECADLQACETFPDGILIRESRELPMGKACITRIRFGNQARSGVDTSIPIRLPNLLLEKSSEANGLPPQSGSSSARSHWVHDNWLWIVQQYMDCNLTYDSDRFPAIMGLAKHFQRVLHEDDQYVAGLWTKDLLHGLLWHRNLSNNRHATDKPRTEAFAPSWSWAAAQDAIRFSESANRLYANDAIPIATIASITTTSTGHTTTGSLKLTGYLKETVSPPPQLDSFACSFFDQYDVEARRTLGHTSHFAMLYSTGEHRSTAHETKYICGLIVEATGKKAGEYRRVGLFYHPWGELRGKHGNMDKRQFREFEGFKPGDVVLSSIVVV